MTKFKIVKALHTALALSLPLTFAAAPALFPTAVAAGTLPSPYVSRALDAVLLPVRELQRTVLLLGSDEDVVLKALRHGTHLAIEKVLDRIDNRLELREFQEAQLRFEPQP